ncbi:hypothetical protein SAMN04488062_10739 [Flavobacterium omnivorum]|uniref:Uncharacterized protein n=1 Tax=Flavobacterium omnivorum TaxID=178355 RepID=A0A1G8C3V2_9FLAO|nr:hypothetical protein [Flavobacterium omnivorum]SDH40191.1 hypothetical protein SAMN04488062_10739 [Flavobacterium omnivorum]
MIINFFDILARPYLFNTNKFTTMDANNELRLRLRFYKDVPQNIDALRVKFANYTQIKSKDYFVKIRGYHIWLNIKGPKKAYWLPHLHIEMESKAKMKRTLEHYLDLIQPYGHFLCSSILLLQEYF